MFWVFRLQPTLFSSLCQRQHHRLLGTMCLRVTSNDNPRTGTNGKSVPTNLDFAKHSKCLAIVMKKLRDKKFRCLIHILASPVPSVLMRWLLSTMLRVTKGWNNMKENTVWGEQGHWRRREDCRRLLFWVGTVNWDGWERNGWTIQIQTSLNFVFKSIGTSTMQKAHNIRCTLSLFLYLKRETFQNSSEVDFVQICQHLA